MFSFLLKELIFDCYLYDWKLIKEMCFKQYGFEKVTNANIISMLAKFNIFSEYECISTVFGNSTAVIVYI